jgi:hypothetical protein
MKIHINRAARAAYQIARHRDPTLPEWDSVTDEYPVRAFAIRIAEAKPGAWVRMPDGFDKDMAQAMVAVANGNPPPRFDWDGVDKLVFDPPVTPEDPSRRQEAVGHADFTQLPGVGKETRNLLVSLGITEFIGPDARSLGYWLSKQELRDRLIGLPGITGETLLGWDEWMNERMDYTPLDSTAELIDHTGDADPNG